MLLKREFVIFTDGAARGNPGPSASGYMIFEKGRKVAEEFVFNGSKTNNYAEYNAIIMALQKCGDMLKEADECSVKLFSDSELVVKQLNGEYRLKSPGLKPLNRRVVELSARLGNVEFKNVRRENKHISEVDRNLNILLDSR